MAHTTVSRCLRVGACRGCRGRASRSGALSGRVRVTCCKWTPSAWPGSPPRAQGHRQPLDQERRKRGAWAGVLSLDHRRPLPARLHRDPPRRNRRDRHRLRRARPGWFADHGIRAATAANRQRLDLHQQPLLAELFAGTRSSTGGPPAPPSATGKSSATSRPWPANGLRTALPLSDARATRCRTGSALQLQAPQLDLQPAANQPRSERPEAQQLAPDRRGPKCRVSAAPVGSSNGREKGPSMSGVAIRVEHCHVPARVARCEPHVLPPPDGHAVARPTLVSVVRQVCSVTSDVPAAWMQQPNPEALDPLNPSLDLSYGRHNRTSCLTGHA